MQILDCVPPSIVEQFPPVSPDFPELHKYLESRGISEETYSRFNVRTGMEPSELGFCFTNILGNVIGMVFRDIYTKKINGLKVEGVDLPKKAKAGAFFGMHLVDIARPLLIVEGECFPGDAEVLTPTGWVRFDCYSGQNVLQIYPDRRSAFVTPTAFIKKHINDSLIELHSKGYYSLTTKRHNIVTFGLNGKLYKNKAVEHIPGCRHIPRVTFLDGPGIPLSDDQIRLCIAVSADFSIDHRTGTAYHKPKGMRYAKAAFKKERKIERIKAILNALKIKFVSNKLKADGYTGVCFHLPDFVPGKLFDHSWIGQATLRQRQLILEEIVHWDGNTVNNRNQIEFSSVKKENIDFVQAIAHTTGHISTIMSRSNRYGSWYKVSVLMSKDHTSSQSLKKAEIQFNGDVFCVSVPSGMILVRQQNKVTVTGNCDAMLAYQYGFRNVLSPGGMSLTKQQAKKIQNNIIIVGFDNDEAGEIGYRQVCKLMPTKTIFKIDWSPYKDVGEIPDSTTFWTTFWENQARW